MGDVPAAPSESAAGAYPRTSVETLMSTPDLGVRTLAHP
jgi:hypothetical protein